MLLTKMLLCLVICIWLIISTERRLARGGFSRAWRIWFVALCCVGLLLGFRLMSVRYLVSPTGRAYGVPFVTAGGDFIDGRWMDGGVGRYMPLPFLADLAFGIALCLLPLAAVSFVRARKREV